MARPNEYTRARFYTMQAGMWVLLLTSIGVAALVNHVRRGNVGKVRLSDPLELQTVTIRLPAGWRRQPMESDTGIRIDAVERERQPWARRITVIERTPGVLEPLFIPGIEPKGATPRGVARGKSIDFGDAQGTLSVAHEQRARSDDDDLTRTMFTARGRLGSGKEILVYLEVVQQDGDDEELSELNEELTKQVAASVKALTPGEAGPQLREK